MQQNEQLTVNTLGFAAVAAVCPVMVVVVGMLERPPTTLAVEQWLGARGAKRARLWHRPI